MCEPSTRAGRQAGALLLLALAVGCGGSEKNQSSKRVTQSPSMQPRSPSSPDKLPDYLMRWPGLSVRDGDRIVPAPAEDEAVARGYPQWPDKGPLTGGRRLTILTRSTTCAVNERVRILHVVEVTEPGQTVYVMGPKPIVGEYVDGRLVTGSPPADEDPLVPGEYDGATLPSPAVDYNYDITTYTFATPGVHQVYWQMGALKSNVLRFEVTGAP